MCRWHHDVEVDMGFTQPRAKGLRILWILYLPYEVVQPTCTVALGYTKRTNTNLDGMLLGGGYEIYSPRIEQSDWTVWTYHGGTRFTVCTCIPILLVLDMVHYQVCVCVCVCVCVLQLLHVVVESYWRRCTTSFTWIWPSLCVWLTSYS